MLFAIGRGVTAMSALDPNRMSAADRLTEVAEILAIGIRRLREKATEPGDRRDVSLDFPAQQSLHGRNRRSREKP